MILLTGASGFVGKALVGRLTRDERSLRLAVRGEYRPAGADLVRIDDIGAGTDWSRALQRVDTVIHAAARVHVMRESTREPVAAFRRVNVDGTLRLGRQAAGAGVRRLIFISSIKVNGETTDGRSAFAASDAPAPVDAYGVSKMEAESGLREIANETGMEVTIVRPPLVYGPGVKGNFLTMMRWLRARVPLPLGAVNNRRSLVALDNLADLITTCVDHPRAGNQTFFASDGEDLSTTQLLRRLARALGVRPNLIPIPSTVLRSVGRVLGQADVAARLCGSLQIDSGATEHYLGWRPLVSVDEGLRKTAEAFMQGAT
jgi:nucleoside-diphosphate-sugar epimerase